MQHLVARALPRITRVLETTSRGSPAIVWDAMLVGSSTVRRIELLRGGIQVLARFLSAALPVGTASSTRSVRTDQACRIGSVVAGACIAALLAHASLAQDMTVDRFRESALDAMGAVEVERIELTGAGWDACLGQAWNVNDGWARWEIRDY